MLPTGSRMPPCFRPEAPGPVEIGRRSRRALESGRHGSRHRSSWLVSLLTASCALLCAGPVYAQGIGAPQSAAGWREIPVEEDAACSQGTPFRFMVHPGSATHLFIYFQGGGACWSGENCDVRGEPTYDPLFNDEDHPARLSGIFELGRPENPLRDFTGVFVPYCTGDVHLGDRRVTYRVASDNATAPSRELDVRHYGYRNAQAVLEWIYANVPTPELIFVTGGSAGAIPSPFIAARVQDRYPAARVVQLGDGAGGYRVSDLGWILSQWGVIGVVRGFPEFEAYDSASLNYEALYIASARARPRITFAQVNTAQDEVQLRFLRLLGVDRPDLPRLLEANYADIRRAVPGFRTFTAPGTRHTILGRPEFYTLEVQGVRLRDWVADLLAGKPVEDVGCAICP